MKGYMNITIEDKANKGGAGFATKIEAKLEDVSAFNKVQLANTILEALKITIDELFVAVPILKLLQSDPRPKSDSAKSAGFDPAEFLRMLEALHGRN